MLKRFSSVLGIGVVLLAMSACTNKKVVNPIADVNSKQPDKILFDRAMDAMKHNKFDVARLTLQTLINTYPDSEFVARAKLAIGDSWYAEGGSAALTQAENEYKDFETFFPNMPEAAEAQLKIANIHYREMEKPDRDPTHAKRAEEEYRQLIMQYPDSKLVPEAKQRLLEVQEVLAEREYRIGRFYFLRESWAAAVARLKSLTDAYPLYSQADEALFMLGNCYERQVDNLRASNMAEAPKGALIKEITDKAAQTFSKVVTRYPAMPRAEDAKRHLEAMNRPVPTPTPDAIAQNKKEIESRSKTSMWGGLMGNMRKGPDMAAAAKVGEPTLVDPQPTNAPDIIRQANESIVNAAKASMGGGNGSVSADIVKTGTPPPNQPVPRSDAAPGTEGENGGNNAVPELQPVTPPQTDNAAEPPTPPAQLNEVKQPEAQSDQGTVAAQPATGAPAQAGQDKGTQAAKPEATKDESTSKVKKKKGLRKIVPF